jgi:hypothetical protein
MAFQPWEEMMSPEKSAWRPLMRKSLILGCVALLSLSAANAATPKKAPAKAPATVEREPEAMAALDRMGQTLQKLQSFSLVSDVISEQVLNTGQKLQYGGTVTVKARKPNRFRIDMASSRQDRSIFYNGSSVTVFAPKMNVYATVPAPNTIRAVLKQVDDDYGIELPLADLFSWGSDPSLAARITSVFGVGTDTFDGQPCDHFAVRQPHVDWEIWIRQGADALPCKMVITTKDDPAMPEYIAVMHWNTSDALADDTFTFVAPDNAHPIAIAKTDGTVSPAVAK